MKTTVIHHSADYDGLFCREIARKFLPESELIGWDYGDPVIPFPTNGTVYVLDLSPDCLSPVVPEPPNTDCMSRMVWIDHHKSAIDKWNKDIPGYRIDGVAACRLAWQWFNRVPYPAFDKEFCELPCKEYFVARTVREPLAVRLAGEYDIWDHRGDGDLEFQFGLDAQLGLDGRPEVPWKILLEQPPDFQVLAVDQIIQDGRAAMRCYAKRDSDIMLSRSFITTFEGLTFLALNTARCNSNSFAARDLPDTGHDALMAFFWNGTGWTVSLYHANHRKDIDLSEIAIRRGGGGHRGACGFRAASLPFLK